MIAFGIDPDITQMGLCKDSRLWETLNTAFDREMIQARFGRFDALKAKVALKKFSCERIAMFSIKIREDRLSCDEMQATIAI